MQIYSRYIEGVDIESSFLTLNNNVARIVKSLLDLQDGGKRQMTMKCRAVSTDYSRLFAVAFWCARATVEQRMHMSTIWSRIKRMQERQGHYPLRTNRCNFVTLTNLFLRLYYLFFLRFSCTHKKNSFL